MARNWQYPRWRRLLMQSAMWLILGGTVGLAALLDRHQHEIMQATLDSPVQVGPVHLQLPAKWMTEFTEPGMVTATESNAFPPRRSMDVTIAPPAEQGLVDELLQKQNAGKPKLITFGSTIKVAGTLYAWVVPYREEGRERALGQVIATTILPGGPEVTLRLEHLASDKEGLEFEDDVALIRRIAATVQFDPSETSPDQDGSIKN